MSNIFNSYLIVVNTDNGTNIAKEREAVENAINKLKAPSTGILAKKQDELNNICKENPNESDCIRTARKKFNSNGGTVPIKLEGSNCFIYRSGNSKKYWSFTPRPNKDLYYLPNNPEAQGVLSTTTTFNKSLVMLQYINEKDGHNIYKVNVYSGLLLPLIAVLDRYEHVAIRPVIGNTIKIDISLAERWADTKSSAEINPDPLSKLIVNNTSLVNIVVKEPKKSK